MLKSHRRKTPQTGTIRHVRTSSRSSSQNPVNLGLQVTRQLVSLFSGTASSGTRGSSGVPGSLDLGSLLGGNSPNQGSAQLNTSITGLTQAITSLQAAETANTTALNANTQALTANTAALHIGGSSGGLGDLLGGSGGGLADAFGGGGFGGGGLLGGLLGGFSDLLGFAPLAMSLFSLFSGPSTTQGPTPFTAPQAMSLEVANTNDIQAGFPTADTFADGTPRSYNNPGPTQSSQPTQVNVSVSTMDSRSFQDNAPLLASAVRTAMLNMNPINQMVRENL